MYAYIHMNTCSSGMSRVLLRLSSRHRCGDFHHLRGVQSLCGRLRGSKELAGFGVEDLGIRVSGLGFIGFWGLGFRD